jgi:hypothetical protein
VKSHPPTHFFSNHVLHFESSHHLSLGFFASFKVFEFRAFESFQICMQHKVYFKWLIDPWILFKNLLEETCFHHESWRESTIWKKLWQYLMTKLWMLLWQRFHLLDQLAQNSHHIPYKFCNNKIKLTTSSMAIIIGNLSFSFSFYF